MAENEESASAKKVIVTKNGPYIVEGSVPLTKDIILNNEEGVPVAWEIREKYPGQESYQLCRCGGSSDKPFCDGSHLSNGFNGSETANVTGFNKRYKLYEGPGLEMKDEASLCSALQFCHREEGAWRMVKNRSGEPEAREMAIDMAQKCSSGRLVPCEKGTGKELEPRLDQAIGVVEDPGKKVSGPLRVLGGIQVESAGGANYEVRNRQTLCRCGGSRNKPFCDGTHLAIGFDDGDESLR